MKHDISLGTSEIFGVDMRRRQAVIDTIRSVYETFGFEPLHTPILENAEVFNGHHGEGEKLLFTFADSQGYQSNIHDIIYIFIKHQNIS